MDKIVIRDRVRYIVNFLSDNHSDITSKAIDANKSLDKKAGPLARVCLISLGTLMRQQADRLLRAASEIDILVGRIE